MTVYNMPKLSLEETAEAVGACVRAGRVPLVLGPPGVAKCLGLDVPVLKFDGAIVRADAVVVGDLLMGPDSTPRRVLSTTRGTGPMFRIVPIKGDPWTCNDVHVLTLVGNGDYKGHTIDIPLDRYLAKSNDFKWHFKLFQPNGISFTACEPPPIDPYFLGVWFGDGVKALDGVGVSKPDVEIEQACRAVARTWQLEVHRDDSNGTRCPTWAITNGRNGGQPNALLTSLRTVVGPAVEIPRSVITGDRAVRLSFLAGFLDTDGSLESNCYVITQKRRDYADAIAFIARSLGLRVTERDNYYDGTDWQDAPSDTTTTYRRLVIFGDVDQLPLRIARKRAEPRKQIKKTVAFRDDANDCDVEVTFTREVALSRFTWERPASMAIEVRVDCQLLEATAVLRVDYIQRALALLVFQIADQLPDPAGGYRVVTEPEEDE